MPHRLIVRCENFSGIPSSSNTVPEKIIWMISANGITVIATFSLVTTDEIIIAIISDA